MAGRLLLDQGSAILEAVERVKRLIRRAAASERRIYVIGFVGSTIYGPMPELLRRFRTAAPQRDVSLVEMETLEQITALKDGRIDLGFGRLKFDDPAIRRELLAEEPLVVALPTSHRLCADAAPISLSALAFETLLVYPRSPRPSFADQVLTVFCDSGLEPRDVQEVHELQTALGLVAAEAGVTLVPQSVQRLQRNDITYRRLLEPGATTPIIMRWRKSDTSSELAVMIENSRRLYAQPGLSG
jgi:DNA-binding transcriptional LysR family regulator